VLCTGLGTILQFHQIVFEFDRDFVSNDFFQMSMCVKCLEVRTFGKF
jgi:hypothetical protein